MNSKELKKPSKHDMVKNHLMLNGTITTWEAIEKYGATRLSAIIFNLRKKGYNIVTHDKLIKDRNGYMTNIAVYELIRN